MKTFKCSYKDNFFSIPREEFLEYCRELGEFDIIVCKPEDTISIYQFRWYKMTVRKLSELTGNTQNYWEIELMSKCGHGILQIEYSQNKDGTIVVRRPSVKNLTLEEMTAFIENILSYAYENNLDIKPPDHNNRYK